VPLPAGADEADGHDGLLLPLLVDELAGRERPAVHEPPRAPAGPPVRALGRPHHEPLGELPGRDARRRRVELLRIARGFIQGEALDREDPLRLRDQARLVDLRAAAPFSPRALDRGLAGTLVALARQGHAPMTPPLGAGGILAERGRLDGDVRGVVERARAHADLPHGEAEKLAAQVGHRAEGLLDAWSRIADDLVQQGVKLQYQKHEAGGARPLLRDFLDPELGTLPAVFRKFRANRSMRDVEPNVNLWVKTLDGVELSDEKAT
jgi:hypothetical protein